MATLRPEGLWWRKGGPDETNCPETDIQGKGKGFIENYGFDPLADRAKAQQDTARLRLLRQEQQPLGGNRHGE